MVRIGLWNFLGGDWGLPTNSPAQTRLEAIGSRMKQVVSVESMRAIAGN